MHAAQHLLRRAEIEALASWFPPEAVVLEVGSGSGQQAAIISSWGCRVAAVDLPGRVQHDRPLFPVVDYDGTRLPFRDRAFDVVYTSNVLEHVVDLPALLAEMDRVARPEGHGIHVLPSSAWRAWSILTHYVWLVRSVLSRSVTRPTTSGYEEVNPAAAAREVIASRGLAATVRAALFPPPHGEFSNALVEIGAYRRRRWRARFERAGLHVEDEFSLGIFYTGLGVLPRLSMPARRRLASLLGSATNVFVVRAQR